VQRPGDELSDAADRISDAIKTVPWTSRTGVQADGSWVGKGDPIPTPTGLNPNIGRVCVL
jgi:hypothetical protein